MPLLSWMNVINLINILIFFFNKLIISHFVYCISILFYDIINHFSFVNREWNISILWAYN